MRVVLVLLVLIVLSLLARSVFAKQGAEFLKHLFSVVAQALGVIYVYMLLLSVIEGHSFF